MVSVPLYPQDKGIDEALQDLSQTRIPAARESPITFTVPGVPRTALHVT